MPVAALNKLFYVLWRARLQTPIECVLKTLEVPAREGNVSVLSLLLRSALFSPENQQAPSEFDPGNENALDGEAAALSRALEESPSLAVSCLRLRAFTFALLAEDAAAFQPHASHFFLLFNSPKLKFFLV